jgi:hypothetical protein
MEVLRLQVEGEDVGEDAVERAGDVAGCRGRQIRRRAERRARGAPSPWPFLLRGVVGSFMGSSLAAGDRAFIAPRSRLRLRRE